MAEKKKGKRKHENKRGKANIYFLKTAKVLNRTEKEPSLILVTQPVNKHWLDWLESHIIVAWVPFNNKENKAHK